MPNSSKSSKGIVLNRVTGSCYLGNRGQNDALGTCWNFWNLVTSNYYDDSAIFRIQAENVGAVRHQWRSESGGGNAYLRQNFPKLDYIKTARVIAKP